VNPAVPEVYNKIVGKMLAKDPAVRYQTGADVIADLRKLEGSSTTFEEIEAEPVEEVTVFSKPLEQEAPDIHQDERGMITSHPTLTQDQERNPKRLAIMAGGIFLVVAVLLSAIYYMKTPSSKDSALTRPITISPRTTRILTDQN